MDSEIVDAVIDWESTPFSGGYEGLQELADGEFSGVITQGTAWAFMLNGRVIGIEDGSMSAFEQADGTAYVAPTPVLPLLYVMQTRGEKQTQYYTNKKSISEADTTLSSGGFTGYIELSENVLSGDYYTVYYGGKSMSVAFVGNSRKLLTDDEAFERADDEVGIYTVYEADLEVIEIPMPAGASDPADETVDEQAKQTADKPASENEPTNTAVKNDSRSHSTDQTPSSTDASTDPSSTTTTTDASSTTTATDTSSTTTATDASSTTTATDTSSTDSSPSSARSQPTATPPSDGDSTAITESERSSTGNTKSTDDTGANQSTTPASETVFSDEAEWRNTKTIPSLDPSDDPDQINNANRAQQSKQQSAKQQSAASSLSRSQLQKRLQRAEQIMQKAEAQHEQLIAERDALKAERDEATQELDTVRAKLSEAEAEIERLESQLDSTDTPASAASASSTGGGDIPAGSQSMSTTEALDGTNLLVRYASKGDGTLEDAIAGSADQPAVRDNLRIEPHTTFDSQQVSVDGHPFDAFLEGRIELAFVRWLAEEFLFDIQQTGNQSELSGIYEALPAINRAELRGSVPLGTDEDGNERFAEFDLVVRDKRDRPLFVADFNESKQPVGSTMVDSLVRDGGEIIQQNESFAAAFAVTTSYYEGAALDAAADATGGGLLSASRGKSFVYSSRKHGFHLCLVEQLGDTFDLHVPEL